jgi:hypothetical protein
LAAELVLNRFHEGLAGGFSRELGNPLELVLDGRRAAFEGRAMFGDTPQLGVKQAFALKKALSPAFESFVLGGDAFFLAGEAGFSAAQFLVVPFFRPQKLGLRFNDGGVYAELGFALQLRFKRFASPSLVEARGPHPSQVQARYDGASRSDPDGASLEDQG